MADYIDRVALLKHLADVQFGEKTAERWDGVEDAFQAVKNFPAADVVDGSTFRDCRNELCLKCGEYRLRYKGACDGCRWLEVEA